MLPYLPLKYLIAALLATSIVAAFYPLLPERRSLLLPNEERGLVLFFDKKIGGNSLGYWDSRDDAKAICEINPGQEFPFCGLLTSLGDGKSQGRNFEPYHGMRVSFKYAGEAPRLRIFMRNYDPLFSKIDDVETAKFMNISVPVEDLAKPLYLSFSDFSVAEWWLGAFGVPRDMSQPEYNNIIKFGFDLPSPAVYGRHELQLDRLELVGKWMTQKQWYMGIAVFWLILVLSWIALHRVNVKRWAAQDLQRLAEVTGATGEPVPAEAKAQWTEAMSRAELGGVLKQLYDAKGYRCDSLALVLIDVDGFSKIKRRYGHGIGKETLVAMSRIIISNSRATDIICHWSNDRFLVLAPGARGVELAAFAEKIRCMIEEHRFYREGGTFKVTICAGVAESTPARTFEQTFMLASHGLLQAKALGKNRIHCNTGE